MHDRYAVFFVCDSNTKGNDTDTFRSFRSGVLVPALAAYAAVMLIVFSVERICRARGKPFAVIFTDIRFFLPASFIYLFLAGVVVAVVLKAWQYVALFYEVHKKPTYSEFYEKNYVLPENAKITFPKIKRNLVVILMESMESSYASVEEGGVFEQNLIPQLTSLAKHHINFSGTEKFGGGMNVAGTTWTCAGMISKLCGLPYFSPFCKERGNRTCLAHATCLTDILKANGYNCVFSLGSDKRFENRDVFLENHGVQIHDIAWYKAHGYIPRQYQIFWGFEDDKLFAIAKNELTALGKKETPFFYGMLTVDTHFPDGYKCSQCPTVDKRQIMNVIRCADAHIFALIEWMKVQSWWNNTTVVIMGDHNYLDAPKHNFIVEESPLADAHTRRAWLNIIVNSSKNVSQDIQKNRRFCSYDMFPTMLESIGCSIEGGALAFGRSLYSGMPTLAEQYGAETLAKELMQRTVQYERLKFKMRTTIACAF